MNRGLKKEMKIGRSKTRMNNNINDTETAMKRTNVKPFALDIRAMICLAAYADGTAKEKRR